VAETLAVALAEDCRVVLGLTVAVPVVL